MNEMFLIIKLVVKFFKNFFVYIKFVVMFIFSKSMFKFVFFCFDFNLMLINMNLR